jgi:hypothetical protein
MYATTAQKSAKKITTKTVSTRVPHRPSPADLAHVAQRHGLDFAADAAGRHGPKVSMAPQGSVGPTNGPTRFIAFMSL